MAGHNFLVHIHSYMKEAGFVSCQGDPDVLAQPSKKDDGMDVWEYFLLYTDDYLVMIPKSRGRRFSIMKCIQSLR